MIYAFKTVCTFWLQTFCAFTMQTRCRKSHSARNLRFVQSVTFTCLSIHSYFCFAQFVHTPDMKLPGLDPGGLAIRDFSFSIVNQALVLRTSFLASSITFQWFWLMVYLEIEFFFILNEPCLYSLARHFVSIYVLWC